MIDNFINDYFIIFLSPLKNINQLPIFYQLTGVENPFVENKSN